MDDDLNADEDFLGFYWIGNIKGETIVKAIKDIFMRCSLSLDDCKGQTYDGASNMIRNIPVFLPLSVKSDQKQLQHVAKAIRWG